MNRILLKNAHLWDCGETVDLLIEEDSIQKIASNITDRDAKVVNLNYKTLYPGFLMPMFISMGCEDRCLIRCSSVFLPVA